MKMKVKNKSIIGENTICLLKNASDRAEYNWDYISGVSGEGPVIQFEKEVKKFTGGKFAIAMSIFFVFEGLAAGLVTRVLPGIVGAAADVAGGNPPKGAHHSVP